MQVLPLDRADPLEEGIATHSSIIVWRIPQIEEPGRLQSIGLQTVRCDWSHLACKHKGEGSYTPGMRSWQASPCPWAEWLEANSIQFSCSVMSDSLQPHELQHARPHCPSPTPGVYPNAYPSSRWCHPTISSSAVPLLLLSSILPSIRVFSNESVPRIRWPSSIGVSGSTSVLSMNTQGWSPLEWTCQIFLQSKGLKSLLQHHSSKASILGCSAFFIVQLSHPYMRTGKTITLTRWTFVGKVSAF